MVPFFIIIQSTTYINDNANLSSIRVPVLYPGACPLLLYLSSILILCSTCVPVLYMCTCPLNPCTCPVLSYLSSTLVPVLYPWHMPCILLPVLNPWSCPLSFYLSEYVLLHWYSPFLLKHLPDRTHQPHSPLKYMDKIMMRKTRFC